MDMLMAEYPFLVLLAIGMAGMFSHWLKRFCLDQTALSITDFFRVHKKAAFGSMVCLLASMMGMVVTGLKVTPELMAAAYLLGFNLQSVFTPHD